MFCKTSSIVKERKIFLSAPKLSIIVPGYNVEQYISDCLDSIVDQTFTDYEVILVDDGSPDKTGDIMDEYASKYEKFRVVHTLNGGLSVARNRGLAISTGEYIAFVDSDDILLPDSYELLVSSLDKNGADIAIGGVERFDSKRKVRSFLHKNAIHDTILGTSIKEHPELVYDTTVWNKVYKKSLIMVNNLLFPEGVFYEDIAFTLEAHLLAKKVNIIDSIVYKWRWREGDNRSLTQRRNDTLLYGHRLLALNKALDIIKRYAAYELIPVFMKKVFELDIPLFIPEPKDADLDYLIEFQKITYRFMQELGTEYLDLVSPNKQVPLRALLNGDIEAMSDYEAYYKWGQEIRLQKGNLIFTNDYLRDKKWADQISLQRSVPLMSKIGSVQKKGNYHYFIEGVAYANYSQKIKRKADNYRVELIKVDGLDQDIIKLPFSQKKSALVKDAYRRKTTAGLEIELDFTKSLTNISEGIWKVQVTDSLFDLKSTGFLANPKKGAIVPDSFIYKDFLVDFHYNYNWELTIIVTKIKNKIEKIAVKNDRVKLVGQFTKVISAIELVSQSGLDKLRINENISCNSSTAEITIGSDIPEGEYQIDLLDENSYPIDFVLDEELVANDLDSNFDRLNIYGTTLNCLQCDVSRFQTQVVEYSMDKKVLQLNLAVHPNLVNVDYKLRMISKNKQNKYVFKGTTIDDNKIQFSIDLVNSLGESLAPGTYSLFLDILDGECHSFPIISPIKNRKVVKQIQEKFEFKIDFTRLGGMQLFITENWNWVDNTPMKRSIGYSILYPLMRLLPIKKNLVVYDSFWASKYNDNPKSMYQYLYQNHPELEHVWLLKNTNIIIDGPARKVRKNSLKYWYYLARGKYFIENTNMPNQFSKRNKQVEVQTFHGTFMKTMGFDEPVFKYGSKKKQENFEMRNKRWDLAISPSPYMTKKVRDAFDYKNEVVESGYPRNDQLYTQNTEKRITEIKDSLGIPLNKKVALYAPTYRNKEGFDFNIDLQKMKEKLNDKYVLLVRLHYFVANRINIENYSSFAIDVSNYDEINDLYLISDVLITDYSSVMFDFGHLKKPMIFFAYDYEDYINDVRGVYLDYKETVPGPIVRTSSELTNSLMNIEKLNKYHEKLDWFYDKFCSFGRNGEATKAVSERMLQTESNYVAENLILSKIKKIIRFDKWYGKVLAYNGKRSKKNIVIFETFFGHNYSDNPKAIYEYAKEHYPEYKFVWSVNPGYVDYFKENHIPFVKRLTIRSTFTTGRAKYWILNTRLPLSMKKPKSVKMVQTWHGTPLKTLGRDVSLMTMPGKDVGEYHKDVIKDSSKWDYCLSPNAYSTEIFKRAFRLRNEQMINSGYPRNDILTNYTDEEVFSIKHSLNIPIDKKVILYAPTWRDNEYVKADQYTAKLHLDLREMEKRFGNEAILLIRTHYLISNSLDLKDNDFCIDVSDYQDINDLYLISDLLITDYSSVFFDFANLHRPIIFYAYDLEDYAGEIRGFYFDYNDVPGPILTEELAVYEEIDRQLKKPTLAANFEEFSQKYCSWDDGNSSERAARFIFEGMDYEIKELPFEEENLLVTHDIILWSDAIGHGEYHILKNILASNQNILIKNKAILVDPIYGNEIGEPCYLVRYADIDGWISNIDYESIKSKNK